MRDHNTVVAKLARLGAHLARVVGGAMAADESDRLIKMSEFLEDRRVILQAIRENLLR